MADYYPTPANVTITPVYGVKTEPEILCDDEGDLNPTDMSSWSKCEFCEYKCAKKDRLSRHVRTVHFKDKPYGCLVCDACFGRKDKMKRHMATVHSQERPFKCPYCPHSSGRKDKIKEHVQSVHLKNRPYRSKKSKQKTIQSSIALPQYPIPPQDLNQQFQFVTLTPVMPMTPYGIPLSGDVSSQFFPRH